MIVFVYISNVYDYIDVFTFTNTNTNTRRCRCFGFMQLQRRRRHPSYWWSPWCLGVQTGPIALSGKFPCALVRR